MNSVGVRFRWRKRTAVLFFFFRTMDRINDYTRYFTLAPAFLPHLPLRGTIFASQIPHPND